MIDPAKTPIRDNTIIKRYVQTARNIRAHHGLCTWVHCADCPINGYKHQEQIEHSEVFIPKNSKYGFDRDKSIFVKKFLKRYDPFFENSLKKNKK